VSLFTKSAACRRVLQAAIERDGDDKSAFRESAIAVLGMCRSHVTRHTLHVTRHKSHVAGLITVTASRSGQFPRAARPRPRPVLPAQGRVGKSSRSSIMQQPSPYGVGNHQLQVILKLFTSPTSTPSLPHRSKSSFPHTFHFTEFLF
jgi:hypothetical protein